MTPILNKIQAEVYDKCALIITNFSLEVESKEYAACQFKLNGKTILCRNAKVTPKKAGQFVTFWKRNEDGTIEPFHETDTIDFFVVNVQNDKDLGQFVFPKSILLNKGIITTESKEGKRAFRVYPSWDSTKSKQAERTQKWQLEYFYSMHSSTDFDKVTALYQNE